MAMSDDDHGCGVAKAVDKVIWATIGRLVDGGALEAWRQPIDIAFQKAFGDLGQGSMTWPRDSRSGRRRFWRR
ncbi:MAG: hypothetical protein GX574_10740 [Lentisphaerae bacterium]|nr:hypothetical protein [Lentisphaerota bacterium]HQL86819.1 hypothetical protein [Lentisphaeria bacterium]